MKNLIKLLLIVSTTSLAALPPEYQNEKDLNVMVNFVKDHPKIISTLKKIDFKSKVIYFADDCRAVFGRKHKPKPKGWVGPADPLEFKKSNCEIDYPE